MHCTVQSSPVLFCFPLSAKGASFVLQNVIFLNRLIGQQLFYFVEGATRQVQSCLQLQLDRENQNLLTLVWLFEFVCHFFLSFQEGFFMIDRGRLLIKSIQSVCLQSVLNVYAILLYYVRKVSKNPQLPSQENANSMCCT